MSPPSRSGSDVYDDDDRSYYSSSRRDDHHHRHDRHHRRHHDRAPVKEKEYEEVEIIAGKRKGSPPPRLEFLREHVDRHGDGGELMVRERSRSRSRSRERRPPLSSTGGGGGRRTLEVEAEVDVRAHSRDRSRRRPRKEKEEVIIKDDRVYERPREREYVREQAVPEDILLYSEPDRRPRQVRREREEFYYDDRGPVDGRQEVVLPPVLPGARDPRGQEIRFEREEYDFRPPPRIREPSLSPPRGGYREEVIIRDEERDRSRYRDSKDEEILIREREREYPRHRDEREEVIIRREDRRGHGRYDDDEEVIIRDHDGRRSRSFREEDVVIRRDDRGPYRRDEEKEEDIILRHNDDGRGRHEDQVIIRKRTDRSPSHERYRDRPPIHQEVITHHTHVDHGFVRARSSSPNRDERIEIRRTGTSRDGRHYDDDIVFERETGDRRRLNGVHRGRGGRVYEDSRDLTLIDDRDRRRFEPIADPRDRMWTEITRDLVSEDAIKEFGYEYEETPEFYYVMEYLRYEDVLALVELTEEIQHSRRRRIRQIRDERDFVGDEYVVDDYRPRRLIANQEWDEERIHERDVIYEGPSRRYY